jgi:hypothetical protein
LRPRSGREGDGEPPAENGECHRMIPDGYDWENSGVQSAFAVFHAKNRLQRNWRITGKNQATLSKISVALSHDFVYTKNVPNWVHCQCRRFAA